LQESQTIASDSDDRFALKKKVDQSIANRVFSLSSGSQPLSDYLISGAVR
jgi:hypothetical protein